MGELERQRILDIPRQRTLTEKVWARYAPLTDAEVGALIAARRRLAEHQHERNELVRRLRRRYPECDYLVGQLAAWLGLQRSTVQYILSPPPEGSVKHRPTFSR